MSSSRILLSTLCASLMLAACTEPNTSNNASAAAPAAAPMSNAPMAHEPMVVGNVITGEGFPTHIQ